MKGNFIIVDINSQEFFKNGKDKVKIFDTIEDAARHCGIYELHDSWICELKNNHFEKFLLNENK